MTTIETTDNVDNGATNGEEENVPMKAKPFERRKLSACDELENRFFRELLNLLKLLSLNVDELVNVHGENANDKLVQTASEIFGQKWKLKDETSEMAFRGLLLILERCLSSELANQESFAFFLEVLGFHTVMFWKRAVQFVFESDMQYGTNYRDALLFSLTLYDANHGKSRLRELFAAVPGLQNSLLGKSTKRFEEAFHVMMQRRGNAPSPSPFQNPPANDDSKDMDNKILQELRSQHRDFDDDNNAVDSEVAETFENSHRQQNGVFHPEKHPRSNDSPTNDRRLSVSNSSEGRKSSGSQSEQPDTVITGGLASGHFQERVITVSNAPPVSLKKREDSGCWEIGQGSGGLVSCCDPVMSKDASNMWLACFGPDVPFGQTASPANTPNTTPTNSLGLPIIRPINTEVQMSVLQAPSTREEDELAQEIKDQISLLGVLRNYNKDNYKLNPVVIAENDYNTYYGGISNGLLWPALHNLPEFILKAYDDPNVLHDHWHAYVRVNYMFALNAVRNSRPQDFLWIHDYHLMLTGMIVQSLDPNLEVGFFLHIPFQPPEEFFSKFKIVADAVLRGLITFTKVGFQTVRDRETFVEIIKTRFPSARVNYNKKIDKHIVVFEGSSASLGVFPVSIKNEDFLDIVRTENVQEESRQIRERVMRGRNGAIFFSVERFDYTKGIKEKLLAYINYFKRHPDRIGKDVFFQVAVMNRRTVDTYRDYQDECLALAEKLNAEIKCADDPDWKPLVFKTDGLKRPNLVAHYLAMDVGVVTPRKDGMNLVAKEMLICNANASLVLSCGAGTEQQFSIAGFYSEFDKCYHRVVDIHDADAFADTLYEAAIEEKKQVQVHSLKLHDYLMTNNIEKWSQNFLDPSWTHDVIQVSTVKSLKSFYSLMFDTRNIRRQIVLRVLKGLPIRPHFAISLKNAQTSLEQSCEPDSKVLVLTATDFGTKTCAHLDVTQEIRQLEIDEAFLNYVQSEAYDNLEQFLFDISKCHPDGVDEFNREIEDVIKLISRGDHFQYFFTDRDGTLSAYACTYPSSIQGAYNGVIQATFAQRCTQYAAIITSAPLQNVGILDVRVIPDGYYCYGASCGREWYVNSSMRFKDESISDKELELLDKLADKISEQLENQDYVQFAWIGSGVQRHYGHITVSHQDVYKSVDENMSHAWYSVICSLVHDLDPQGKSLKIQETETDIKIYLRAKLSGRIFTKGHGLRLFAEKMKLNLEEGNILVCADSETDLPMLKEVLMINPQNVYTVWVTKNEDLKRRVIDLCEQVKNSNYAFPSSPLVLLGAMAQATIREIKIRPGGSSFDRTDDEDLHS